MRVRPMWQRPRRWWRTPRGACPALDASLCSRRSARASRWPRWPACRAASPWPRSHCAVGTVGLLWRRRWRRCRWRVALPSSSPAASSASSRSRSWPLAIRRRGRELWPAPSPVSPSPSSAGRDPQTSGSVVISDLLVLALALAPRRVRRRPPRPPRLAARAGRAGRGRAASCAPSRPGLAERTRIAQEMHDVLAHKVSLIALHAGGLEVSPDDGRRGVERSARLIRDDGARRRWRTCAACSASCAPTTSEAAPTSHRSRSCADVRRLVDASSAAAGVRRRRWPATSCRTSRCPRCWAHGVPGRAGGADQRAQARAGRRDDGAAVGRPDDGLDVEVTQPSGRSRRGRCCRAPVSGWSACASASSWPAAARRAGATAAGGWRVRRAGCAVGRA